MTGARAAVPARAPGGRIEYRRVTSGRQHEDVGRAGAAEPVAALDVRVLGPIAEADAA